MSENLNSALYERSIFVEKVQNSTLETPKSYLNVNIAVGKVCAFGHINIPWTNGGYKKPMTHHSFV